MSYGNSKREKLDALVRRAVGRALRDIAWNRPNEAAKLKELARELEACICYEMTAASAYAMREIEDVIKWKKPPKES